MRVVAIVQARMGSTRLPGKVLADLHGQPVLQRVIQRLKRCATLDEIVVATTMRPEDGAVVGLAEANGVPTFRGPETDVLLRYLNAANEHRAGIVVRITADCPLIAPGIVDAVVCALDRTTDLASNAIVRTYPRGLDAEAFHIDVLTRMHRAATSPQAREHVTWHAYMERPDLYVNHLVRAHDDNSNLSWTLDTAQDLEYLRRIYDDCDWRELVNKCLRGGRG